MDPVEEKVPARAGSALMWGDLSSWEGGSDFWLKWNHQNTSNAPGRGSHPPGAGRIPKLEFVKINWGQENCMSMAHPSLGKLFPAVPGQAETTA